MSTVYDTLQPNLGYQIDQENHAAILQYGQQQYYAFKESFKVYDWEPPKEIDPRDWFDIEDQQNSNSCAGNSLADCGEWCNLLADGKEIQLSRYFAYLASQDAGGGIRGDNGAYLEAGTQAAAKGICLEERFPWSTNYATQARKYKAEINDIIAGPVWRYPGAVPLSTAEDAYRFLSSWTGGIHIGIAWSLGNSWEVKSYSNRGGGHALLIPGYLSMPSWPMGIGFLLKNSWGKNWGRNGWALIHPDALNQMMRSRGSTFIGRSDMVSPRPRVEAIDYYRCRTKQWSGSTAI